MALVSCNLCNKRISSKAKFCPKCGCPNINREETVAGKAKNCGTCSLAPTEPGLVCNLCDVPATDFPKLSEQEHGGATGHGSTSGAGSSTALITDRIAGLAISSDLKEVFNLIALSERDRGPLSEMLVDDDSRLRCFRIINSRQTICSNCALFFGAVYYFIHGVWRKGSLLALITLAPALLFLLSATAAELTFAIAVLYVHVTCYCRAKRDRYRLQVLEERFWW
jgi:hypothetical protein